MLSKENNSFAFSDLGLPRAINLSIKLKVYFGNVIFLIGFVFTLFGCVFLLVFGSQVDFKYLGAFNDSQPKVKGFVYRVLATNSSENEIVINKYIVQYIVNGKQYSSYSYYPDNSISENDSVFIQYDPANPSVSVIPGMRKAPFDLTVLLFVMIFPIIGIVMAYFGFKRSKENIRLLRIGLLTKGKVLNKYPTNTKINNRTVYEVHFEFKTKSGQMIKSTVKTHQPEWVEDEEQEHLVYDAEFPEKAVLIDVLPKSVKTFLLAS